jgi:hypothetical protein
MWVARDAPARIAPAPVSTVSVPTVPRNTARARGGSSSISRLQGASARAPPSPPATRAIRKPDRTACSSEGVASADWPASASARHQPYGTARASSRSRRRRPGDLTAPDPSARDPEQRRAAGPGPAAACRSARTVQREPHVVAHQPQVAAVRSTPGSPAACGAAIHPASTSRVMRQAAAPAHAAISRCYGQRAARPGNTPAITPVSALGGQGRSGHETQPGHRRAGSRGAALRQLGMRRLSAGRPLRAPGSQRARITSRRRVSAGPHHLADEGAVPLGVRPTRTPTSQRFLLA